MVEILAVLYALVLWAAGLPVLENAFLFLMSLHSMALAVIIVRRGFLWPFVTLIAADKGMEVAASRHRSIFVGAIVAGGIVALIGLWEMLRITLPRGLRIGGCILILSLTPSSPSWQGALAGMMYAVGVLWGLRQFEAAWRMRRGFVEESS